MAYSASVTGWFGVGIYARGTGRIFFIVSSVSSL
jgi:hypothetical protein